MAEAAAVSKQAGRYIPRTFRWRTTLLLREKELGWTEQGLRQQTPSPAKCRRIFTGGATLKQNNDFFGNLSPAWLASKMPCSSERFE